MSYTGTYLNRRREQIKNELDDISNNNNYSYNYPRNNEFSNTNSPNININIVNQNFSIDNNNNNNSIHERTKKLYIIMKKEMII